MSKENNEIQILGKAVIQDTITECAILIRGEKIAKVSKIEFQGVKAIRFGQGFLIIPAMIDLHVHFRDWGQAYKETIESASLAALAGGITTALDMPNTLPPVDSLARIMKRIKDFEEKSHVDFAIHSKPVPIEELEEARKLAFAFKFYEEDLKKIESYGRILEKDRLVFHAQFGEDEVSAVKYVIKNTEFEGVGFRNVRFAHISRKESIEILRKAKRYRNVFIEVTPHHAFISKEDVEKKHLGYKKVRPPLASREDNVCIMDSINSGIVDFIATDHAPHSIDEKLSDDPPPGYPSLEIVVPIFFTFALKGILDIFKVIRCTSYNPARYLGIKKGLIKEGYYADLAVLDLDKEFIVDPSKFVSMSKFSPFEGYKLRCKPILTVIRGNIAFFEGNFEVKGLKAKKIEELAD